MDLLDFLNYRPQLPVLVLLIVCGAMLLVQLIYYFVVYGGMLRHIRKSKKHPIEPVTEKQGVSIVIVANNNGEALREGLLQFLEQDYETFEVVVVNENSSDDTEYVLFILKENYPNLTVINLGRNDNKFDSYKFSLSIGIRSAEYPNVLLANVTSKPKNFNWLTEMMNPVNSNQNIKITSGICLREESKGLRKSIERYAQARNYINLISFALAGNTYSACGMNMIYDKDFFISKSGFIPQYAINCSQEDYFVHRHGTKTNTAMVLNEHSFVWLPKYDGFSTFVRMRVAESFSHKVLAMKDRFLLTLNPLAAFLFYVLAGGLLVMGFPWQYIVVAVLIKWISQIVVHKKCTNRLTIKKGWFFVPFMEIFFFFFDAVIKLKTLFYRKKEKKIRWDK